VVTSGRGVAAVVAVSGAWPGVADQDDPHGLGVERPVPLADLLGLSDRSADDPALAGTRREGGGPPAADRPELAARPARRRAEHGEHVVPVRRPRRRRTARPSARRTGRRPDEAGLRPGRQDQRPAGPAVVAGHRRGRELADAQPAGPDLDLRRLGIQMLLVYLLPSWLLRQVAPARRCWCMARCARRTCTGATGTSTPTCTCWPPANGAPAGPGLPGPQRREAPEDLRPGHQDVAEEDPAASGDSKARRPVGFRVVSVFGERSLVCPPDVPGPPRLLLASWTASRRTGCGRRWPRRSPQPATGCSPTSRPPGPPRRTG